MPLIFTKKQLKSRSFSGAQGVADRADMRPGVGDTLVLDFEWEGQCYFNLLAQGKNYIPIHKKPWKIAENLDIIVPFGYNTVIVKSRQNKKKKPVRDRLKRHFTQTEQRDNSAQACEKPAHTKSGSAGKGIRK